MVAGVAAAPLIVIGAALIGFIGGRLAPQVFALTSGDSANQKDYGPTFGARLTLDLFYMYDRWFH